MARWWVLTVFTETQSSPAISRTVLEVCSRRKTSRSRSDSASSTPPTGDIVRHAVMKPSCLVRRERWSASNSRMSRSPSQKGALMSSAAAVSSADSHRSWARSGSPRCLCTSAAVARVATRT